MNEHETNRQIVKRKSGPNWREASLGATVSLSAYIGRLIKQQKPHKGNPAIFERYNILVTGWREWREAPFVRKIAIAANLKRCMAELAALGERV